MRALGVDIGTRFGWALRDGEVVTSGVWVLQNDKQRRFEGGGMKWLRLYSLLETMHSIDMVFIEEVRRHLGTDAAHAYGGALAVISSWCESKKIPYSSIPVGTIKRHAAGKGNASKEDMINAAISRGWAPIDDNAADALWVLDCGLKQIKG